MVSVCPMMLSKPWVPLTSRRSLSRSSRKRLLLGLDGSGKTDRLADQVGDHLQETCTLFEQPVGDGRLGREDADRTPFAESDRHADEGQLRIVETESIEEARLVADARQDPGPIPGEDAADHAFAGLIGDAVGRVGIVGVKRADQELAAILAQETDHPVLQAPALVQDAEHLAQGLAQVERAAEHRAHLEECASWDSSRSNRQACSALPGTG
jgi:hypothetical protein